MIPLPLLLWMLGTAVLSALLTGAVRRLAMAHAILDLPNARSLHRDPTPRIGGLAILLPVLAMLGWLHWRGWLDTRVVTGLLGAALLISAVGWLDDLRGLSNRLRAAAHFVAAAWFLYWVGGLDTLQVGERTIALGILGVPLALLGIVWSVNLYNFMDGIDGLAGGQAVIAAGIGAVALAGVAPGLSLLAATVAGACLGFLVWNWAPARIFMGDVGSGLLGFLFAALALLSEQNGGPPIISWAFGGSPFIFDATVTLARRALRGERWYAPHRSHAYQRAVQSGWGHARVAGGVMAMGLVLGLLGTFVARRPTLLVPCAILALVLLGGSYLWIEKRLPMGPAAGK